MRKSKIFRISLLSSIVLSILFLTFFQYVNISHAQVYNNTNKTLNVPQNFPLLQSIQNIGTKTNVSSIDINLPSNSWNITDIMFNFTNIQFQREIKTIEPNKTTSIAKELNKKIQGLAIQIMLNDTTRIYGVELYLRQLYPFIFNVKVQIQGYDNILNKPNKNIHASQSKNISSVLTWYYHKFSPPIDLPKGNYSLVVNASGMTQGDNGRYLWYYNLDNPQNPNLYFSRYDYVSTNWDNGIKGEPFLYKLDQKILSDFYPKKYNMTIKINGINRSVLNGTVVGSGNLYLSNVNFTPNDEHLHVPIYINKSSAIVFNLSHNVKMKNTFSSNSSVLIKKDSNYNNWTLTPKITKYNSSNSVKFKYPKSWINITIYEDDKNITKYVTFDFIERSFTINDYNITNNAKWLITAISPNIDFLLIVLKPKFDPGQEIIFSVNTTDMNGNITFILFDALGYNKSTTTTEISLDTTTFSYTLPSNPNPGSWNVSIFWYNSTDAGFEIQVFQVSSLSGGSSTGGGGGGGGGGTTTIISPPTEGIIIDPLFLFFIAIISSISATAAGTSYVTIKRVHRIREVKKEKLLNKCIDVLNLNYIILMNKDSGLTIYEQFLSGKQIEGTLISGFLQAIRIFGIELTGAKEESQTIKLEYQDSKILMSDFKNFRLLLMMKKLPSPDFLESVKALSYEIEEKFGNLLADFKGDVRPFSDIKTLIEKHLNIPFIYPLKVDTAKITNINKAEQSLITRATYLMKANELDHFYMLYLMGEKMFTPKDIKNVFSLIDKKIFYPKT